MGVCGCLTAGSTLRSQPIWTCPPTTLCRGSVILPGRNKTVFISDVIMIIRLTLVHAMLGGRALIFVLSDMRMFFLNSLQ